ncbi:MAG: polynucleotide adenylyltransferase PcnB [Burkholderia sp.]|nr:polynucleotide adenylyltransferase PcnB [Burkholderia sp.]
MQTISSKIESLSSVHHYMPGRKTLFRESSFLRSKLSSDSTKLTCSCYEPTVIPVSIHRINPSFVSQNAIHVTDTLQRAGFQAFIVGGAVRDLLLGIAPKDFDVATDATPTEVQRLFRRARVIGRRFQITHVQFSHELIEVSTFRAIVDAAHEVSLDRIYALKNTNKSIKYPNRSELDRHTHAVDSRGRVLRDNVWGKQHEDAARRDFTINAMYYDPKMQTVLDYHNGMADVDAHILRVIGDPVTRYREDPVRMLRVVRFAAKLGFDIETHTREPIRSLSNLINSVPGARLFDEILKLLLSGRALACLNKLRHEGLHHRLLPLLDFVLEQPQREKFIRLALNHADERVRDGKSVSPGFLFATLLWHDMRHRWKKYTDSGEFPVPALHHAIDDVLNMQTERLTIQKRYSADMREIWGLQLRFEKRSGRRALRLLEHPRFRAGYDFLMLRCESGDLETESAEWWTRLIKADSSAREILLTQSSHRNEKTTTKHYRMLTADDTLSVLKTNIQKT